MEDPGRTAPRPQPSPVSLISALESRRREQIGSAALLLGGWAGKLGPRAAAAGTALYALLEEQNVVGFDRWLCASALRKIVCAEPSECAELANLLPDLLADGDEQLVDDLTAALTCLLRWADSE